MSAAGRPLLTATIVTSAGSRLASFAAEAMPASTSSRRSAALAIGRAIGAAVHPRQTALPRQWLIADERLGNELWPAVRKLRPGSGVILLFHGLPRRERAAMLRQLRRSAPARRLTLVDEAAGGAARVHDVRELRRALLARTPLVLLSPVFPTRSHPERRALPLMRAAAMTRLAGRRLIALGGMDARRFARVHRLGFSGWAAIDAFRT